MSIVEQKKCKDCELIFEIKDDDDLFYKSIKMPRPSLCPDCRHKRRLAFRNERNLYKRSCDFSKKNIISNISPDKPYKVFENEIWFSDKWDPTDYGRPYDFGRNFFDQYFDLFKEVPQIALIVSNCENCNYTNYSWENKDCYLVFDAGGSENCLYCQTLYHGRNVMDSSYIKKSTEICYDSLNCSACYNIISCKQCYNSSDLTFCYDMKACQNCFLSSNLRNKEYYFKNIKYTKDEYFKKVKDIDLGETTIYNQLKNEYIALIKSSLHVDSYVINSDNCLGDHINNSKNCHYCFNIDNSEDCKFCFDGADPGNKNCFDDDRSGWKGELCYETIGLPTPYNTHFSISCGYPKNLDYCYFCNNCEDCFGCVSLKKKKYCILNKQYGEKEYFLIKQKIVDHMITTHEWGEFFPISKSPFCYNETLAQDYFPISKDEAVKKNYKFREEDLIKGVNQSYIVKDNIKDVDKDILHEILMCNSCKKNYRIIPQELNLLKSLNVPVPLFCPECRNSERKKLMTPMKLWKRFCDKCNKNIESSYSIERPEIVYCETCYLKEVY